MKNPATHRSQDELNVFTQHLYDMWVDFSVKTLVRLRDGTLVQPVIFLGEDHWEDDFGKPRGFMTEDRKYCWNLDGTSVTNRNFDMMEII